MGSEMCIRDRTTLTLALRGDDDAVTTVLDELRLAADVEEVAA